MSEVYRPPVLEDERLQAEWAADERIQITHAMMAEMSLDEMWSDMPQAYNPNNPAFAEAVDLSPEEDHDRRSAIVLPLPFANGWAPHMGLRAKMLAESLDTPTRLIVFPNDPKSYVLDERELHQVKQGDFNPIAMRQLRMLEALGIEKANYIGYSQGATVGATALKLAVQHSVLEVGNSGLFEPPNTTSRNSKELQKAFTAGGISPLNKAIADAAVPALQEAQHSRGGLDTVRQLAGFAMFGIRTKSSVNRAIHEGFGKPVFGRDLKRAVVAMPAGTVVSLAAAEDSAITSGDELKKIADIIDMYKFDYNMDAADVDVSVYKGYGHELGDNIVAHTILAKLALRNS